VVDTLQTHIDAMNERLSVKNRSRPFQLPSQESPFVNYRFLDALFKVMEQVDYRTLPAQSSQGVMQVVFQNWKSFFASIKDYRNHPEKYQCVNSTSVKHPEISKVDTLETPTQSMR
jgi:putative transposase